MKQNTEHSYRSMRGAKSLSGMCLLLAALLLSFTSCSDDEEVTKSALGTTTIAEGAKTVSTIAFSWSAIEGATQYAYELRNVADEIVLGGMTAATSMLATGLDPETTYTLKVWSYAALGSDKTTSPIATLTATTNAVEQLDKPTSVDCTNDNGSFVLTWPAVEDAEYYLVFFDVPEESLADVSLATSVEEPTLTLRNVEVGEHTVYVFAMNDDENFSMSEGIKLTFTKAKSELWRKECNYYSAGLDQDFTCQIVSYDDGSYTIEGIYDSSHKLEFSVDAETDEIIVNNFYSESESYYYVTAGEYILGIYPASGYSEATISRQSGEVWFYTYLYDSNYTVLGYGYDYITWGSEASMTIDDLVGEYTSTTTCYDYIADYDNPSFTDIKADVTIEKVDDTSVSIYNFHNWEETFTATVDLAEQTITIQPCTWGYYYTFAGNDSAETPVVATFDEDGNITFDDWTAWYNGSPWVYYAETTLSKKQ